MNQLVGQGHACPTFIDVCPFLSEVVIKASAKIAASSSRGLNASPSPARRVERTNRARDACQSVGNQGYCERLLTMFRARSRLLHLIQEFVKHGIDFIRGFPVQEVQPG